MKFIYLCILCFGLIPAAHGKSESSRKKIYKELGLSHAQAKSLYAVRKYKLTRLRGFNKELRRVQKKINQALIDDKSDKILQNLHRKKIILQAKIKQEKFNSTLSVRKLLTKSQRKNYIQLKKKYSAVNKKRSLKK